MEPHARDSEMYLLYLLYKNSKGLYETDLSFFSNTMLLVALLFKNSLFCKETKIL